MGMVLSIGRDESHSSSRSKSDYTVSLSGLDIGGAALEFDLLDVPDGLWDVVLRTDSNFDTDGDLETGQWGSDASYTWGSNDVVECDPATDVTYYFRAMNDGPTSTGTFRVKVLDDSTCDLADDIGKLVLLIFIILLVSCVVLVCIPIAICVLCCGVACCCFGAQKQQQTTTIQAHHQV